MLVRFKKAWRMYQPGEVAGFDDAMATSILASGFAVEFDPDAVAEDGGEAEDQPAQDEAPAPKSGKRKSADLPAQGGEGAGA